MDKKPSNFANLVVAGILGATLCWYGMHLAQTAQPVHYDAPIGSTICGTCGAHVTDWWQIRNDANTAFINVCTKCYDANA